MEATSDAKLRQTMMSLSEAVRTIAFKVRKNAAALDVRGLTAVAQQVLKQLF